MTSPSSFETFIDKASRYDSPVIIPALEFAAADEKNELDDIEDEELLYFETEIKSIDLLDAVDFPVQYLYSVTGRVKKKRGRDEPKPGVMVHVNGKKIAIFKYKVCACRRNGRERECDQSSHHCFFLFFLFHREKYLLWRIGALIKEALFMLVI